MRSKIKNKLRFELFIIVLCTGYFSFGQFDIPQKPSLQTSVYDYINLLSNNEKNALEAKLIKYSDTTSTQIVIAIISSTKGENINYLGAQWGQKWGIGQEKEDNGILVLLAKDDRKIAISTGYGIESVLTDALSKRIIENEIIPEFKNNNYLRGLDSGVDAIFEVLTGTYANTNPRSEKISSGIVMGILGLIIFILFIIIIVIVTKVSGGSNKGGGKGKSAGASIWDVIILSNMGRGSYGKSSSGGFGSGGSFGGGFSGGFGGGGASGGW